MPWFQGVESLIGKKKGKTSPVQRQRGGDWSGEKKKPCKQGKTVGYFRRLEEVVSDLHRA